MTDEYDRVEEEQHVRSAMKTCGYPDWSFRKVKHQKHLKEHQKQKDKTQKNDQTKRKHLAIIPYVQGV